MANQGIGGARNEHPLNKAEFDSSFNHDGKRVFYNSNGKPYILNHNGNRNYDFNGKWTWINVAKSKNYSNKVNYDKHSIKRAVSAVKNKEYSDVFSDYTFLQNRVKSTVAMMDDFGGFESYQLASEVLTEKQYFDMTSGLSDVEYEDVKKGFKKTFDRWGNEVYAALADKPEGRFLQVDGVDDPIKYLTAEQLFDKDLPITEGTRDRFVLTNYGENRALEVSYKNAQLTQHKKTLQALVTDMLNAKSVVDDTNKIGNIKVSKTVKEQLGLAADVVTPIQLHGKMQSYFGKQASAGISNVFISDSDVGKGKLFDKLLSHAYQGLRDTTGSVWQKEKKEWADNRRALSDERKELQRDVLNVIADGRHGTVSEFSGIADVEQERAYNDSRPETDSRAGTMKDIWEADNQNAALKQIEKALDSTGHTNVQAKRKILNVVHQSMVNKTPIDVSDNPELQKMLDDTLIATNKYRADKGVPPLEKLDYVEEKTGIQQNPERVAAWRKAQSELEQYNSAYRIKGDKTMYQIKSVTDNGTVLAERMSLPASAFRVKMRFDENTDVINELDVADKAIKVKNVEDHLQLTQTQKDRISMERTTALSRLNVNGDIVTEYIDNNDFTESLIQNNSTYPAKGFRVREGVWDSVLSHAPWMFNPKEVDDLKSNIYMALQETTTTLEGRRINLATETDLTRGFDEQFEKTFIRNLHKAHFEFGRSGADGSSPAESLVNDVAKFVRTYVNEETLPDIDPADMNRHVATEVSRLLNDKAETLITKDFGYYKEALDDAFVGRVLNAAPAYESYSLDREVGVNRFGEGKARGLHEVISDGARDILSTPNDSPATKEARNLNSLLREVNHLEAGNVNLEINGETVPRPFDSIRTYFGEDRANKLINSPKSQEGISRIEVLKNFYQNGLRPNYSVSEADKIIQEVFDENSTLKNSFYGEVAGSTFDVQINSLKDIRDYTELANAMPGLNMSVRLNQAELQRLMPEYAGKLNMPAGEGFEFSIGKDDSLLARTVGTNLTYEVRDSVRDKNGVEIADRQTIGMHVSKPINNQYVTLNPATDETMVIHPKGNKLPVELNTPYDSKFVNSHPTQSGISSSDIGTRQMLKKTQSGQIVTGLDFETTGLPSNKFLQERGLFLPTEAFYQKGKVNKDTGEFELGKSKHVFVDIGGIKDNAGNAVRSIVTNELGSMTGANLIQETLGTSKGWGQLSEAEKLKVMNNDKVSFLRNIAKYSNELTPAQHDAIVDFKNYTFGDLDSGYSQLVQHATIGLDRLKVGNDVEGAKVVKSLKGFVQEYNKSTGRSIILAQNGAAADLAWAKDFSERSGVPINEQPKMIENMQVARMLNPGMKGSSLGAQINAYGSQEVKDLYNSGSHLADKDTIAMTKLFGETYLPQVDKSLTDINHAKIGQSVMKVGARGGNKIPIDVYTIAGFNKTDTGYSMDLSYDDVDGNVKTENINFNSLNEMQRHLSENYKGFNNRKEAEAFRDNLTFDDAREDIIGSQRSFDRMVQNRNRVAGDGVDVGMEKARDLANPYNVQTAEDTALRGRVMNKLAQNQELFNDGTWSEHGSGVNLSDRQRRAMAASQEYFNSEDAQMRQNFLGEVENLRSAGVVADSEVSNLISGFNKKVMDKAAALGRELPQRTVPGLVSLGTPIGEQWGGMNGKPLTAMANTYGQTKDALWGIANQIKSTLPEDVRYNDAAAREQSINKMIGHLNTQGMNITDGNMDSAVHAVMNKLATDGSASVADVTVPLINGPGDTDMINAYQDAHNEVLAKHLGILNERPDLMARYENTKAMRDDFINNGMAVPKMDYTMSGGMEGPHLRTTGDYAFRHADSLMNDLQATTDSKVANSLWREMNNRAMGDWDDREAARNHLGWNGSPEEYRTPYGISDKRRGISYPAGSLMADIPQSSLEFMRDKWDWAPGVQAQAGAYLNALEENQVTHQPAFPREPLLNVMPDEALTERVPITDGTDEVARAALYRTPESISDYIDEEHFRRPEGLNRPESYLDNVIDEASTRTRMAMSDVLATIPGGGRTVVIAGAIAAAGFAVRQWTRGDVIEGRPEHNRSSSPGGGHGGDGGTANLKGGGAAYNGPAPSGGKTYLTDQQAGGYNVQVQAKSNGVNSAQIGDALQGAMHGQPASVNVHHQDDRSSINTEWLTDKFAQLLDNGSVQ